MSFNKDKFLKLLKERENFEKEGGLLKDFDTLKDEELVEYFILIEDQIFWESRKKYCQILDLFVKKRISFDEFLKKFSDVRILNITLVQMWKENFKKEACGILTQSNKIDFQLNAESKTFADLICIIHSRIDLCNSDWTLEMDLKHPELNGYGISEEFLRLIMEHDFLPALKKYCIFHLQH
jgi:hypothetical protein